MSISAMSGMMWNV